MENGQKHVKKRSRATVHKLFQVLYLSDNKEIALDEGPYLYRDSNIDRL